MTEAQKEQRLYALAISGGVCENCGAPLGAHAQAAHRIGNTKANREKWGSFVIDHPMNIAYTCCLKCNAALDISYNTGECVRLIKSIFDAESVKYK